MRLDLLRNSIAALIILSLAGCSTPARVHLPNQDALQAGHAAALTLADLPAPRVTVLPGDSLRIVRDAQEPAEKDDMTLFLVRADGYISVPFIGGQKVDGMTPDEVADLITQQYKNVYRQPQVTVNIAEAPSNRVFVGGAVPNPAFFNLSGKVTLEQALLASGGVLPSADSDHIALLRTNEDRYNVYFISLASLLSDSDRPVIALQRGDLIYVPQSNIGATVEAVDMYFTKLFPINKGIGLGFNYDLNSKGLSNSGNTNIQTQNINP